LVRRGFPAEANRLATTVRGELGLGSHDRFDPWALADEYGIPVVSISELVAEGARSSSVKRLTAIDDGCFSAGTVIVGTTRLIIFNPAHSKGRLANSLAHELGHLLLEHAPGPAIGPGGCRVWDRETEEEADLLAAVLLVPRDAALACARIGLPHAVGAARFGVSPALMRWRTDQSGASRQARAAAEKTGLPIPQPSPAEVRELLVGTDLGWLAKATGREWRSILASCGRALKSGSILDLRLCLSAPQPADPAT
jgi:Zn-dependent peptidase ImmA (M78 family)